jgi:phage terminase large subunit
LGAYHEKIDETRDVGLGPEHDWSSHAADAFGLMAVAYEPPASTAAFNQDLEYAPIGLA